MFFQMNEAVAHRKEATTHRREAAADVGHEEGSCPNKVDFIY